MRFDLVGNQEKRAWLSPSLISCLALKSRRGQEKKNLSMFQIFFKNPPTASFRWLSFIKPDWGELKFHLLPSSQIQTRKDCFEDSNVLKIEKQQIADVTNAPPTELMCLWLMKIVSEAKQSSSSRVTISCFDLKCKRVLGGRIDSVLKMLCRMTKTVKK